MTFTDKIIVYVYIHTGISLPFTPLFLPPTYWHMTVHPSKAGSQDDIYRWNLYLYLYTGVYRMLLPVYNLLQTKF